MRGAFAAIIGLATGVLVAGAPAANGAVLLLGFLVGSVVTLTVTSEMAQRREDEEAIESWRHAANDGLRLEEADR